MVHPINKRREETGLFYTLFEEFRNYENKFVFFYLSSSFSKSSLILKRIAC